MTITSENTGFAGLYEPDQLPGTRRLVLKGLLLWPGGFRARNAFVLSAPPMSDGVQTWPQKRRRYSGQPPDN
jgi:hypothetical protein